jgi:Flp pilus assembly pilin Flp
VLIRHTPFRSLVAITTYDDREVEMYRFMGRIHAEITHGAHRLRADERGQGTIEYVGLIMLMAVLLTAAVAGAKGAQVKEIPQAVADKLKDTIETLAPAGGGR